MGVVIKPNGMPFEEGEIITSWMKGKFKANKNVLMAIIGQTGSGKSYTSIRLAELWYKRYFNEPFPLENIVFSIKDLAILLRDGRLKKGSLIVFEEAGVNVNALDFQNKINKMFTFVMQSFRSKNIGIIFNLPSIGFLNKTSRVLLHCILQTCGMDKSAKTVSVNPFILQHNSMQDKIYNKHFRVLDVNRQMTEIQMINIGIPSDELIIPYEEKKEKFVNKTNDDLIKEIEDKDGTSVDTGKDAFYEQIKKLYLQGHRKMKDISIFLGVSPGALSKKGFTDVIMRLNAEYAPMPAPTHAPV